MKALKLIRTGRTTAKKIQNVVDSIVHHNNELQADYHSVHRKVCRVTVAANATILVRIAGYGHRKFGHREVTIESQDSCALIKAHEFNILIPLDGDFRKARVECLRTRTHVVLDTIKARELKDQLTLKHRLIELVNDTAHAVGSIDLEYHLEKDGSWESIFQEVDADNLCMSPIEDDGPRDRHGEVVPNPEKDWDYV